MSLASQLLLLDTFINPDKRAGGLLKSGIADGQHSDYGSHICSGITLSELSDFFLFRSRF